MFTIGAGKGVRDEDKAWTPDMARELLEYVSSNEYDVTLWELGNEWDLFFLHGVAIPPSQVVADFTAARALLGEFYDEFSFGGVSSAYWPKLGEVTKVYPGFLQMGGADLIDVITWHYYPQQSERGGSVVSDPWERGLLLEPERLDTALKWADEIADYRDADAPGTPIWLGETGHAQYGGQPDSSDKYEGTFWWLDQLGALARRGQEVSVGQTLSGSHYGLVDDVARTAVDEYVRVYAHCSYQRPGAVTLLAINLDPDQSVRLEVEGIPSTGKELYLLSSDALDSSDLALNGVILRDADGALPPLEPRQIGRSPADLPPRTMAFVVFPDAEAAACQ